MSNLEWELFYRAVSDALGLSDCTGLADGGNTLEKTLSRIAELKAAAEQHAGGWLPIDTAPRDGTEILVWSKWQSGTYLAAYNDLEGWQTPEKQEADCGWAGIVNPTHWMPLPTPPEGK